MMRKNILILSHSYGSQFLESCNQYTQLFDSQKYKVIVVYMIGAADEIIRQKTCAEVVIFLNQPPTATRGLKIAIIKQMLKLCREQQITSVICHRYKPSYIMMWVAQFYAFTSLIFVMHAFETMKAWTRKLSVAALFRPNMFFAGVSNAVRAELKHALLRVPAKNILTFYNILDHELFAQALLPRLDARKFLQLASEDFVFGHIARLVKEKDQHNLIKAFGKISAQCPRAKLILIGTGKLEQQLRELVAELKLQKQIIFTGFVPDAFQYMRAFDVFVLPSVEEAFGRVLLEAMVTHLPIIATKVDGIPEVMGESGFLVPPRDLIALANAMLQVYQFSPDQLIYWGDKSYQRLLENFTRQKFYQEFWQQPFLLEK
jgi:glycosyltransferase involved in cell wall biosynthesis